MTRNRKETLQAGVQLVVICTYLNSDKLANGKWSNGTVRLHVEGNITARMCDLLAIREMNGYPPCRRLLETVDGLFLEFIRYPPADNAWVFTVHYDGK